MSEREQVVSHDLFATSTILIPHERARARARSRALERERVSEGEQVVSHDLFATSTILIPHGNRFAVHPPYWFVAAMNPVEELEVRSHFIININIL